MLVKIKRLHDNGKSTTGYLSINGEFECFTLEPARHEPKINGISRIPAGTYNGAIYNPPESHIVKEYHNHWNPEVRKIFAGHIEISGIPNFLAVLVHIGNYPDDTQGCILVGDCETNNQVCDGELIDSCNSWLRVYPLMISALQSNEGIEFNIIDEG